MDIASVGSITHGWGESLVWDDRRNRLIFADCASQTLQWLDGDEVTPKSFAPPSMPTGVVSTTDDTLVVVLEDGLYVVDLDAATVELLTRFPDEIGGRCNDARADLDGNIITGKLNMGPADGSAWQYQPSADRWTMLDDDIANTNGPAALIVEGVSTLIIGDTSAKYFAYDYHPGNAVVGPRRVFGDTTDLVGSPDGSTVDRAGGLWCALVGGSQLARFTVDGLDRTIDLPVENPTDVTFGGPDLDRLYVTSIGGAGDLDGALLAIDDVGFVGRPEPRARL